MISFFAEEFLEDSEEEPITPSWYYLPVTTESPRVFAFCGDLIGELENPTAADWEKAYSVPQVGPVQVEDPSRVIVKFKCKS